METAVRFFARIGAWGEVSKAGARLLNATRASAAPGKKQQRQAAAEAVTRSSRFAPPPPPKPN